MEPVRTLEELDVFLAQVSAAAQISDDAMRAVFKQFSMDIDWSPPPDPHSKEYREAVFSLYERLHGKPYGTHHEVSAFDVDKAVRSPFPYYTKSCATVGNYLIAVGHAIRSMNLMPGASVLEFGPGWGNTTLALAAMGYRVTAIDIESRFCDLIKRRAANNGLDVDVVNADFSYIKEINEPVDAVLFFECFHHASDHLELLKSLVAATKPDGRVFFAAEPIDKDFPVPWGLRFDGESLWAIRQNGWLELGFNERYFSETMQDLGWRLYKHYTSSTPWGTVIEARKATAIKELFLAGDERIKTQIGFRNMNGDLVGAGQGYLSFGPYINLPAGAYAAEIAVCAESVEGLMRIEVAHSAGKVIQAQQVFKSSEILGEFTTLTIPFELPSQLPDVEIRIYLDSTAQMSMRTIKLAAIFE